VIFKSELDDYKSELGDFKLSQLSLNSECTRYYSTGIKLSAHKANKAVYLVLLFPFSHPLLAGYPQI
jgi:hypothetical protein